MVADGLRRTGYDEVALTSLSTADFSDVERHRRRHPRRPRGRRAGLHDDGQPAVAARRRVHRRPRRPGQQRAPQRADVRPRGRLVAAAPGDQQADHRGRPLRRRRHGVRRGLVAGQAVLPHRPADGDRRGHAGHRRAGPQLRRARPAPQRPRVGDGERRRLRAQAAHAVPVVRPEHRAPSCSARSTCCATATHQARRTSTSSGTTRRPPSPRASSAAATGASAGSSSGCGAPAARSRSGASTSTCGAGPTRWRPRACRSTGTSTATATAGEVLPWDAPHGRAARGLPVGRLAGRARRQRRGGLPVDAVLRLRRVHRVRHRARRGLERRRRRAAARAPARTWPAAAPSRCCCWSAGREGCACATPSAARCASRATATRRGSGSGRCGGPACPSRRAPGSRPGRG